MSAVKPTSKLSINDYYLCPPITGVEVGAQKPILTSFRDASPSSTKDRDIKEGLGDYLPNIPGNLNSPGPEDWSLQYLIANPSRGEMELAFFSGAQFMGFILKEGEPIPDHLKMEPSASGTGEKVKKKHKNKKHKANQSSSLNHLLDKIPPDTPTAATHGDTKLDPSYDGEVSRKKDKKSKKTKKGKKDEKKKKKIRYKDDDDRPDKVPSHLIKSFHHTTT